MGLAILEFGGQGGDEHFGISEGMPPVVGYGYFLESPGAISLFPLLNNSPFHGKVSSFVLQWNPIWMRGNFALKVQNSLKMPHKHGRLHVYRNANEKS